MRPYVHNDTPATRAARAQCTSEASVLLCCPARGDVAGHQCPVRRRGASYTVVLPSPAVGLPAAAASSIPAAIGTLCCVRGLDSSIGAQLLFVRSKKEQTCVDKLSWEIIRGTPLAPYWKHP